jgi:hypothetical protein
MPINTPQPRLPLEPEEYPLYRPPSRIGCSGITIVTLLLAVVFAFLIWQVTPPMAKAITNIPRGLFGSAADEASGTPGVDGGFPTQTSLVAAIPTDTPIPPTPVIVYVKVSGTGGAGVKLRVEPKNTARYNVTVGEGATFEVIGPDVENESGVWRHVALLQPDGRKGYVLSKYLIAASGP